MTVTDAGTYRWGEVIEHYNKLLDDRNVLARKWNRCVEEFNAVRKHRPTGRPLQASETQCAEVVRLHEGGHSYAEIREATNLSQSTVRTIVGRYQRTDRTTVKHARLQKIEIDRAEQVRDRRRRRSRDELPRRVTQWRKSAEELQVAGRELLKR
jgi:Helix-turn-helix domain of resolvase